MSTILDVLLINYGMDNTPRIDSAVTVYGAGLLQDETKTDIETYTVHVQACSDPECIRAILVRTEAMPEQDYTITCYYEYLVPISGDVSSAVAVTVRHPGPPLSLIKARDILGTLLAHRYALTPEARASLPPVKRVLQ